LLASVLFIYFETIALEVLNVVVNYII